MNFQISTNLNKYNLNKKLIKKDYNIIIITIIIMKNKILILFFKF